MINNPIHNCEDLLEASHNLYLLSKTDRQKAALLAVRISLEQTLEGEHINVSFNDLKSKVQEIADELIRPLIANDTV